MQKMLIMKGIQASGKSTFSNNFVRDNKDYKRVNRDSIRSMLHDYIFSKDNEKLVKKYRDYFIFNLFQSGYNVIVDDTNLDEKTYNELCEIAKTIGDVEVTEKYFPIDLDIALERNSKRIGHARVPDDVVKNFHNRYIKGQKISERVVYFPKKTIIQDISLPHAIIVDIDGTLAHMTDRGAYDLNKVDTDVVDENIKTLINNYYYSDFNDVRVIIVSGREDICKDKTIKWLNDNSVQYSYDYLYMRKKGDMRKDSIVKEEIYRNYIKDNFYIEFVLDDRNQVVDMWRSLGLKTLQVGYGDF